MEGLAVTPESARWRFLSFSVVSLAEGEVHHDTRPGQETAIVPLSGRGAVRAGVESYEIGRTSVFTEMPEIVYATPGDSMSITAIGRPVRICDWVRAGRGHVSDPVDHSRPDEERSPWRRCVAPPGQPRPRPAGRRRTTDPVRGVRASRELVGLGPTSTRRCGGIAVPRGDLPLPPRPWETASQFIATGSRGWVRRDRGSTRR